MDVEPIYEETPDHGSREVHERDHDRRPFGEQRGEVHVDQKKSRVVEHSPESHRVLEKVYKHVSNFFNINDFNFKNDLNTIEFVQPDECLLLRLKPFGFLEL